MKVLVVMPVAEQQGGLEAMLMELLRNARRSGITWRIVFLEEGPLVAEARLLGIDALVVPVGRLREARRFARAVVSISRLARDSDAILSWMPKGHLYGGLAAVLARKPALRYQGGTPSNRVWLDRAVTLMPARGVLTLSEGCDAAQRAIRPQRRTRLVYPGIDLTRFDPSKLPDVRGARISLGLNEAGRVVGVVARLQRWKGIHILVEALPKIQASFPDTVVVIVGGQYSLEPEYKHELLELAGRLGVSDDVVFAGLQRDIPMWITAMDIVTHPAWGEPFGIAVVEAMALGKPVVASNSGGPLEIIEAGVSGVLFKTFDSSALADAVNRIFDDPEGAASIANRARVRAQHFSSSRFADEVGDAVRMLV